MGSLEEGVDVAGEAAVVQRRELGNEGEQEQADQDADADAGAGEDGNQGAADIQAEGKGALCRVESAAHGTALPGPRWSLPFPLPLTHCLYPPRHVWPRRRAGRPAANVCGVGIARAPELAGHVQECATSVARSSSSSSTRSALRTRPPNSIRWQVRFFYVLAQSRVSVQACAASRRLRSTTSRRSLCVVASRFGGTCLAAPSVAPTALLKENLAAFGPPRDGLG